MKIAKNRNIIYLAGFLFSIALALTSYINSSFLEGYIKESFVGIIYVLASIITILGMLEMSKMLSRIGNRRTTLVFALLSFFSLLMLAFGGTNFIRIFGFIIFFITSNFLIATLDLFVEDFSKSSNSIGKFRGIYITILSSAWVISQSISGIIITRSSFTGIYIVSAMFMLLFAFMFVFFLRTFKDPKYTHVPVIQTLQVFLHNKNISQIYLINFILKFFYVWMIIYTPIYLHSHLGFGWDKIGLIFTFMLLPFVILPYPLGKLSDKIGEKKMLITGFAIATLATVMIPFVEVPTFWIWAGILFATRVGASTIEIMSESYFFKSENEKEADAIAFFRNTSPLAFIIAPLIATPILLFTPDFSYIFYVLSAILLYGLFVTLRLKDVK